MHHQKIFAALLLLTFFVTGCQKDDDPTEKPGAPVAFTFSVSADYMAEGTDAWIFLSDKEGKELAASHLVNGQEAKLETESALAEEGVTLTIMKVGVFVDGQPPLRRFFFYSYFQVSPGNYSLDSDNNSQQNNIGNTDVQITGLSKRPYLANLFGPQVQPSNQSTTDSQVNFLLTMTQSPAEAFSVLFLDSTTPTYKKMTEIQPGISVKVDYPGGGWTPMEVTKSITLPGAEVSGYAIQGVNEDDYAHAYYMWSDNRSGSQASTLPIYFSPNLAPKVVTSIAYTIGSKTYGTDYVAAQPPDTFNPINADIISFNTTATFFELKTSGTYDYSRINAQFLDNASTDEHVNAYWSMYLPQSDKTINHVPEIPAAIQSQYPSLKNASFEYQSVAALFDESGLATFNEFVVRDLKAQNVFVASSLNKVMWIE